MTFQKKESGLLHIHKFDSCGLKFAEVDCLLLQEVEVEANNRVEAEEKAKEYVDKYQADKFFECSTNRVFKIIPKVEGDEK